MCLQAYDFTELNRRHGVTLQMGGSDQWGNIVTGIDLGRRMGLEQFYALTSPLITLASGAKMGKTAAGAIWLDETMLAPYDYWQFWRNADDADVGRFLRLFTLLPLDEIRRLESLAGAEINEAKKTLANEATALLHGRAAAEAAAATARKTFEEGELAESLPTVDVPGSEFDAGLGALSRLRARGPRRLDRRSAPPDPRRRLEGQRRCARRREGAHHPRGAEKRRRRQALARPQEARAASGGVAIAPAAGAAVRPLAPVRARRRGSSCRRLRRESGARCRARSPRAD